MTSATAAALDRLVGDFISLHSNGGATTDYDPQWPSDCYQGDPDQHGLVRWQPIRQTSPHELFDGLEAALETPVHPDLITYYSRYWSDPIPARYPDGDLSLLFVWNDDDYERLRSNLIGHALAKRKQKAPLTFFFACTEPEELVLSLENDSGRILLEQPGKLPLREIAPSMAEFLNRLTVRKLR